MILKRKYRPGIFIVTYKIVKDEIKFLILKRKLHWKGYEFPKGGIEIKEPIKKTLIRELKEENGLEKIKKVNHRIKWKYLYDKKYSDRPKIKGQTLKLFSVQVENKKVKIDKNEHSSYEWLSFKEALRKLTYPNQKDCLVKVHDYLIKK